MAKFSIQEMRPDSHNSHSGATSTWTLAKRALACAKPRFRTWEQVNEITDLLVQQTVFDGVDRDDLLAIAFFMEAKHSEAGECILSKGQPMEHWCLLLDGAVLVTRYSAARGGEQSTAPLGPQSSWSEAALLHSTHPRRSSMTVIAGQQGCITLRMRYTDFGALNDPRQSLQLLPPEGSQGPLYVSELTQAQRRAGSLTLLCCCLRRLAAARPPDERTPEEASELEPFISALPAYRAYPPELVASLASACRLLTLPPGGIVYEASTLADAQVTVLRGEVQLRKFGGGIEDGGADGSVGGASGAGGAGLGSSSGYTAVSSVSGAAGAAGTGPVSSSSGAGPVPPPGQQPPGESSDASSGRLSIRARLRREREARKQMQRQLDEYVSRMDAPEPSGAQRPKESAASSSSGGSSAHVDWTRVFMQKAMRTAEPVWKALHPADNTRRRRQPSDTTGDNPLDEGPITEVAQLLGPAAAKAYYRGLQSQGYSDTDTPGDTSGGAGGAAAGAGAGGGLGGPWGGGGAGRGPLGEPGTASTSLSGGLGGPGGGLDSITARDRWRRWMFSVDGPETEKQRTLRNMAMRASRISRDQNARSRRSLFDSEEVEEMYGSLVATLTRGSPVGELSTVNLHGTMRKESAVAGPSGCELLMVDWEAFQQGVLAARVGLLSRAAGFLGAMPRERLARLAELCLCLSVDAGTLLARQGAPLETMVVLQSGELQLLHEPSGATPHHRISTLKGHAINRSRNGRSMAVPLLASLSHVHVPGVPPPLSAAGGAASPGAGGASGSGGGGGSSGASAPLRPGPPPSLPSFSTTGAAAAEVTLQGLPMGEVGVGAILGESVLGVMLQGVAGAAGPGVLGTVPGGPAPPGAGSGTVGTPGHADPAHPAATRQLALPGGADGPLGHSHGHGHGLEAAGAGGGGGANNPWPSSLMEGPKWPATVLAAKSSVLLVVPRSVLYLPEFDGVRPTLLRFAAERRLWLAKRIEAAYREAAAPPTLPAVFANATANAAAAATAAGTAEAPASPPHPQQLPSPQPSSAVPPSLRRSVLSSTAAAAAAASAGGAAAAAATSPSSHDPFRRAASGELASGSTADTPDVPGSPAGTGAGTPATPGSPRGLGIPRRRSVESFSRYSNGPVTSNYGGGPLAPLTGVAAGAAAAAGGGGAANVSMSGASATGAPPGPPRLANKWDFLDNPTTVSAGTPVGAEASNPWMAPPIFATGGGGSFSRSVVLGLSPALRDGGAAPAGAAQGAYGGGSFTTVASPYGSMPLLRRPSSGMLRGVREAGPGPGAGTAPGAAAAGGGGGGVPSSYDMAGLSPVQQALLEVGFDPALAAGEPYTPDVAGARRNSALAVPGIGGSVLPALGVGGGSGAPPQPLPQPPRLTINPHARASLSGGPSPVTSLEFDPGLRPGSTAVPLRSPNALTPTPRRSYSGTPGGGPLVPSISAPPSSLLDCQSGVVLPGRSASPGSAVPSVPAAAAYIGSAPPYPGSPYSVPLMMAPGGYSNNKRASYSGYTTAGVPMMYSPGVRRPDVDAPPTPGGGGGGAPASPRPPPLNGSSAAAAAAAASIQSLGSRVPGLAAVEMMEAVAAAAGANGPPPASPGSYTRQSRSSYTSGGPAVVPRMSSVDTSWMLSSDGMRRGGAAAGGRGGAGAAGGRGGGGGGTAAAAAAAAMYDSVALEVAEAEEEVALARSLVPKNQAGNFMVREGVSSTPTKQPAVRRIANCF